MIGFLATAIEASIISKNNFLVLLNDEKKSLWKKNDKKNHLRKTRKGSIKLKGANNMTVIIATFMVSIGVLGRDSDDVLLK